MRALFILQVLRQYSRVEENKSERTGGSGQRLEMTLTQESTYCSIDPQGETGVSMHRRPIKGDMKHKVEVKHTDLCEGLKHDHSLTQSGRTWKGMTETQETLT